MHHVLVGVFDFYGSEGADADVQDDLKGIREEISQTRQKLSATRKTEKKVSGELSRMAVELLREHGYEHAYAVAGGFDGAADGWKQAGMPWSERAEPGWIQVSQ